MPVVGVYLGRVTGVTNKCTGKNFFQILTFDTTTLAHEGV